MITQTSLTHPTMIAKIRLGMKLAALGKGHEMNGHDNRVYIANEQGHNVIRCSWLPMHKRFAFYISGSSAMANGTIERALMAVQRAHV